VTVKVIERVQTFFKNGWSCPQCDCMTEHREVKGRQVCLKCGYALGSQRPEVKERQKAYSQRPEVKEQKKAYSQRPEVKEQKKKIRRQHRIEKLEKKLQSLKNSEVKN
jgi:ribosomal protein S27AE